MVSIAVSPLLLVQASMFWSIQPVTQKRDRPSAFSAFVQQFRYKGPNNLAPLTKKDRAALLFGRDDADPEGREHRQRMERMIRNVQDHLVNAVESMETKKFEVFLDRRSPDDRLGGGGLAMVLQDGSVFEKAGVNISCLRGGLTPRMLQGQMKNHEALRKYLENKSLEEMAENGSMFVAGVSVVMHPVNPFAPTGHCNYRYFELKLSDGQQIWWYGGGADLTPAYVNEEEAVHFHQTLKDSCDKANPTYYQRFKKWCDEYFYIPYRKESRGIGGIFFDDVDDQDKDKLYQFAVDAAENFSTAYLPLVAAHKDDSYDEEHKRWQALRRGRYVEFNLGYDRGTKFGLALPNPRTEKILMSLPLNCRFETHHEPSPGSAEAQTLDVLLNPREWIEE